MHAFGAQRVGRHRRRDRRIDAARKADHHRGKPGLVHIVAQAEHHRLIDGLDLVEFARDRTGLALPTACAAPELDRRDLFGKGGELGLERAIGAQREGGAVIDDLVLAADLIEIDEGQAALDHALDAELHAHVGLAGLIGRTVGHQQDFAAGLGDAFDDIGCPHILADRHADSDTAKDQRSRHRAGREDALVVEHAIVRQVDLEALADDLALVERDDRIVQLLALAPRRRDEQGRTAVIGVGAQGFDRVVAGLLEGRLQHQVFGRVARKHQFRGEHEVGALPGRFRAGGPHLGEIAGHVADLGIELGQSHFQFVRHLSLRRSAYARGEPGRTPGTGRG